MCWVVVPQFAYSFKDEVALVEVAHKHNIDAPAVRVFVKAAAGANIGIGHPSAGAPSDSLCLAGFQSYHTEGLLCWVAFKGKSLRFDPEKAAGTVCCAFGNCPCHRGLERMRN